MIARIFWILFALEAGASVVLALSFFRPASTKGWGPEGPVGGWLLLVPPVIFAAIAAVVLIARSDRVKLFAIVFMVLPLVQIAIGPLYEKLQSYQSDRRSAGDETFRWPAQRKLAHAIKAHDAALVKILIPSAGDLNKQYHGETLLRFAVYNAEKAPGSVEVVQTLLDAGASPSLPVDSRSSPLAAAISDSPRLTEALLRAGADPNRLDDAKRPDWWNVLSYDSDDQLKTLQVLLDHGADLTKRDSEGGPVAWAAYSAWMSHGSAWRIVSLLIDRGAAWKDEQEFGRTVIDMFQDAMREREGSSTPVSAEMRKLQAKIAAESPGH